MDYIRTEADGQLTFTHSSDFLLVPSCLHGFENNDTSIETAKSGRSIYCHKGILHLTDEERKCTCGCKMHINTSPKISLQHLNIGGNLSCIVFPHNQLRCPKCKATKSQYISFKADGHRITEQLLQYTRDLLACGTYTNKQVSEITGLGKNTVKAIDKKPRKSIFELAGALS